MKSRPKMSMWPSGEREANLELCAEALPKKELTHRGPEPGAGRRAVLTSPEHPGPVAPEESDQLLTATQNSPVDPT